MLLDEQQYTGGHTTAFVVHVGYWPLNLPLLAPSWRMIHHVACGEWSLQLNSQPCAPVVRQQPAQLTGPCLHLTCRLSPEDP